MWTRSKRRGADQTALSELGATRPGTWTILAYTMVVRWGLMLLVAAACAGAELDPDQALARLREIVRGQAAQIPNYTCVQTIDRLFFRTSSGGARLPWPCRELDALKRKGGYRLIPHGADRFRLDVRVGPGAEMYSWVGDSRFEDRPLRELIGSPPSSTGSFGPALMDIVEDAAEFKFEGEKTFNGRGVYAYSFHVPVARSHHSFAIQDGSDTPVAYEGTILADRETGAPVQLTILAGELPPEANCCRFTTALEYRHVSIGAAEFLLPFEALQRFVMPGGPEVENTVTFSACREYRAQSTVTYGSGSTPGPAASADAAPPPSWDAPAGLPVTIALTTRIDSAVAAAGDPFTGRLATPVLDKLKNVIAPQGAFVRGRVARVVRILEPALVTIDLRIETVEIGGLEVPVRLTGKNDPAVRKPPFASLLSRGVPIGELPRRTPTGYAAVQCNGKRCVIRDGFRTEWVTVGQP